MNDAAPDVRALDDADELGHFRSRFHIPRTQRGDDVVYLCGNSLGLQPKSTAAAIQVELDSWARRGVGGHFEGPHPWFDYHQRCTAAAAHIVGALDHEVVMMNALTVNLHLLMLSFYRPTASRRRVLIENGAFPSDRYAVTSHLRARGVDVETSLLEIAPPDGASTLDDDTIERAILEADESLALVLLGGVNYVTGQLLDIERITAAAHRVGAVAAFDLAHAAGNVPLRLHDWGVDFAVWCSYKYLNSGPGGVGGAFVHERYADRPDVPRLAGWWGNDPAERFAMPLDFEPQRGAAGWQLSNAPVLPMAAFVASGEIFTEATMTALRRKSERQTKLLLELLADAVGDKIEVLTPRDATRRGCQISLRVRGDGRALQRSLEDAGVVCDFRPPDVLRVAPTPLYNTFSDVHRFVETLARSAL